MRDVKITVEVSGAPKSYFNGTYTLTNSSKVNNKVQYTKTGSFKMYPNEASIEKRDDGKWYFIQWTFDLDNESSKVQGKEKYVYRGEELNRYRHNVPTTFKEIDHGLIPPESGWYDVYGMRADIKMITTIDRLNESSNERFLFSDTLSDVHLHCPDGTILHAHKVILSMQSSYFATVFEGPWDKEHPNGIWVTSNSPDIMKVILTFIYTGVFTYEEDQQLLSLLTLAHEYELKRLVEAIEEKLILMIDPKSIKDITQKAYIYSLDCLKESCCTFIYNYFLDVLMDGNFMKLATESESIWSELQSDMKATAQKILHTTSER